MDSDHVAADPGEIACPAEVTAGILACVEALQADPSLDGTSSFLLDQLLACADPGPVAASYDAYCATEPTAPACSLPYETFVADVLPSCVASARDTAFAGRCALPATVDELRFSPWWVELSREVIDEPSAVASGSILEQQLLAAVGGAGQAVTTAADALARTDDDAFDVHTLLDVGTRRTVVFLTATYDGARHGRAFFEGTVLSAARVDDGALVACAVETRLEGTPCDAPEGACGDGVCLGLVREEICVDGACSFTDKVLGEGRCVHTWSPDSQPARGALCTQDAECPRSQGLVCMRLGEDGPGFCDDAWLRRRFPVGETSILGATTVVPFVVSGVASTSLRTTLSMVIRHPNPADLTVSLRHPGDATQAVVYADPFATGGEVALRDVPAPLPADEGIQGVWQLIIEDSGPGAVDATASRIEVAVESWFD